MVRVNRWSSVALALAISTSAFPAATHAQSSSPSPGTGNTAAAPRDSAKTALLRQLVVRTQVADQAIAMLEASIPMQRQSNPRIPAVFWDRFLVQAKARRGELVDMISVIYDRHFTADELRQLLAFYDTPLGRKLLAAQPTIAQESLQAGQEWGQRVGTAIGAQLAAEGIVITP
jgi:uncharacterized protein